MWWTLACLSGCLGLAYELLFERAYSLICGDLYLTYAAIVLTFIFGGSLGNLCGYRLRRALPALEIAGGIIALIFGLFLRIGGYLTTIPTPVMIALLLLPSFIVGLHLPLYGHYFYQKAFDKLYTIYHLGATLGLLAIECLLIPHFALSTIFIICGSIQIIIGISVAYQTHTGRFQIKKIDLQIPQLVAIARQNAGILTLVFTMSLLSYYFHFFLIKILNFYEVITRPTYSFFSSFLSPVLPSVLGLLHVTNGNSTISPPILFCMPSALFCFCPPSAISSSVPTGRTSISIFFGSILSP